MGDAVMTVIAMTREIGSRGADVAAGVASELGLKIVSSEIVASNVATNLGVKESTLQRYFEGSASILERWQGPGGSKDPPGPARQTVGGLGGTARQRIP